MTAAHCVDEGGIGGTQRADEIQVGVEYDYDSLPSGEHAVACRLIDDSEELARVEEEKYDEQCDNRAYPSVIEDGLADSDNDRDVETITVDNDGIFVHPDYSDSANENDIAIVRLRHGLKDFPGVSYYDIYDGAIGYPAFSPSDVAAPVESEYAVVLAYGSSDCQQDTGGTDDTIGPLRYGWNFLVETTGERFRIDGSTASDKAWTCAGDSGGPVFNESHQLIGIVQGHGMGGDDDYTSYAVNVSTHRDWILDRIEQDAATWDSDGDGWYDYDDSCPDHSNHIQQDYDDDGIGDACDPCSRENGATICFDDPMHPNCDHKGYAGAFSGVPPEDYYSDMDEDGVPNVCDNCWEDENDDQADTNGNGLYNSDSAWAREVAVLADDSRGIVATGIYDTTRYTTEAWDLFDRCVEYLGTFGD